MLRKLAILFTFLAVVGIVVPEVSPLSVSVAHAQTKAKRKNLLELLFGGSIRKKRLQRQKKAAAARVKVSRKARRKTVKKKTAVATVASAAAVAAIEKNEDAAKVLVIGDFMAEGLSTGLTQVFNQNPAITFVSRAVGLSGIVRDDVQDWPNTIPQIIDEIKPVLVVLQVGMNDRQAMKIAPGKKGRVKKFSPEWNSNYETRVDNIVKNVRDKRIPLIWVGIPPVSKSSMNQDYLAFNEIYRRKVESYGGTYVDIWNGFTDVEGRYIRSGPNVDGRIVTLRGKGGISMTRSGKAKMAFFAEKAVKRLTGLGSEALFSNLGSGLANGVQVPNATYDPITSGETFVISLASADADGGLELEGAEGFITATDATQSSSFELVAKGKSSSPNIGRIDSGWGRASFDISIFETPEPVLANMRGLNFKSTVVDFSDTSFQPESAKQDANLTPTLTPSLVPNDTSSINPKRRKITP